MINNEQLVNKVKLYNKFLNPSILNKAYNFAVNAHKNQIRKSGDPYVIHPVAVADILTELKLDSATIVTGLLHDTIEDTKATYESVLKEFGKEVADLVDGVTKISALEEKVIENSRAENFRKLILATSKDIRVLLVKIADRLHNMRTINAFKSLEKKERIAKETMEIYAPLADRMGMNRIRDELEDLSFSVLNTKARELIIDRLNFIKDNRKDNFKTISTDLIELLKKNNVTSTIAGREKTPFSIWRKIQSKKISLEQVTDIVGFRIILNTIDDCYKTLGVLHGKYSAIPGKFKDYISTPKINKYKSIHTSIIGPMKQRIEIQIRTREMHEFAERGIASHWKYKSSEKNSDLAWQEYDWLRDLVEIIENGNNPEHYYEFTKLQMFQENVFCFTPNGAVIKLPKDATPIDFAYAVHTKIGDTAISCSINSRESSLQSSLKNGDMVNINCSKKVSPSLHWLSSSKTGKARAAIRRYWQDKLVDENDKKIKEYTSTLVVDLPHQPGVLGEVSTLIGINGNNILNVELLKKKEEYLQFSFDLQINDLKNFTNLISQIKQKNLNFKIIRHKEDNTKNAFIRRIFKNFKRN
jgi:RelA/SpoT family (p)ppGpp synthetase